MIAALVRARRNTNRQVVELLRRISADCRELCAQQNWREKRLQPDELFGQCAGMPPKVKSWIGVRDNAKQTSCNDKDEMRSIQNGTRDAIYLESVDLRTWRMKMSKGSERSPQTWLEKADVATSGRMYSMIR